MAKVVVVEDDALLAKMYVKLLDFEHHQVVIASNGETALDMIKTEQPDLVLMDVMMPKMNGLQALEQLKRMPETKNIPVVVMSNLVNVNSAEEVLARGAVRYVDKSQYDPRQVAALVSEVVNSQPASANPTPAPQPVQSAPVASNTPQANPNPTQAAPSATSPTTNQEPQNQA